MSNPSWSSWTLLLTLSLTPAACLRGAQSEKAATSWTFVVSGDSRNCGDLIMPVIARQAKAAGALFYWHLGDLRALFQVDEDYAGLHRKTPEALTMDAYLKPHGTISNKISSRL